MKFKTLAENFRIFDKMSDLIVSGEDMPHGVLRKLSKPLIGEDRRIYGCSENNFFAFENNGTIAWTLHLDYQCNLSMAPVYGGYGKVSAPLLVVNDYIIICIWLQLQF
ncbi:hypothetical protein Lalb_Chr10g0092301 [Lupinus albus]|uniref:Uncharacterized protein n=1 Tax=Lupinus albus TaxID=3870 RepID=A0A6A4PTH3_LUPAL|nr:hypothetical protein Lalb_Chr10g0092301 [Lupinus albus]